MKNDTTFVCMRSGDHLGDAKMSKKQGCQLFSCKNRTGPLLILRPAGSDPEVVCQKNSFLKVSVSLGGFGPSVAHGKHSVRRRCVQATKKQGRNLLSS